MFIKIDKSTSTHFIVVLNNALFNQTDQEKQLFTNHGGLAKVPEELAFLYTHSQTIKHNKMYLDTFHIFIAFSLGMCNLK